MFDFNDYIEAETIENALSALDDGYRVIAGGTDILIKLRERKEFVGANFVGISRIAELKNITIDADGMIKIGAACTFTEIEDSKILRNNVPILVRGASLVGGPQVRAMGTIGGNVANGAVSADTAPPLFALNAVIILQSSSGTREVNITDFYLAPGKVAINKGELLTSIKIAKQDYDGFKGDYIKFAKRKAMDIANISCALLYKEENGRFADMRIAFGVAAPTPIRVTAAEEYAKGKEISEANIAEIGGKCVENAQARDSWRASKAYRERIMRVLVKRIIEM